MDVRKPHTNFVNVVLICTAALASFNVGYSNNVIAGSFAQIRFIAKFLSGGCAISLVDIIVSGFFGFALTGTFIQTPISDTWGRKRVTVVAAILLILRNAIQAGAVAIAMFLVGRYITGVGVGMLISNTPVYLSEIAPAHSRGLLIGLQGNFIVSAYVLSSVIARGFYFVDAYYAWRLNFCAATFVGLVLLGSLWLLPESPRWLAEHG